MTNDLALQCPRDPFDSNIVVRRANASRGKHDIELLVKWVLAAQHTPAGQQQTTAWVSLQLPAAQDFSKLVAYQAVTEPEHMDAQVLQAATSELQPRDGFDLVKQYLSIAQQQAQAHYCILCHSNQGDFCSRGSGPASFRRLASSPAIIAAHFVRRRVIGIIRQ